MCANLSIITIKIHLRTVTCRSSEKEDSLQHFIIIKSKQLKFNMNIMRTVGISLAVCLMSISFMDMFYLLWYNKEFDDIADLTREFIKPTIVLLIALHFIMNTFVMKKPFHYILSTVVFGLIGIGSFLASSVLLPLLTKLSPRSSPRLDSSSTTPSSPYQCCQVRWRRQESISYPTAW